MKIEPLETPQHFRTALVILIHTAKGLEKNYSENYMINFTIIIKYNLSECQYIGDSRQPWAVFQLPFFFGQVDNEE